MTTPFKRLLLDFLEHYSEIKQLKMKSEKVTEYREQLNKDIRSVFGDQCNKKSNTPYFVKYSLGQGNFAIIPWIAVFDRKISEKASGGYDIVYLFKEDMSGVYLSLNQGITIFKKYAKHKEEFILKVVHYWQSTIDSIGNDNSARLTIDPIELSNKKGRPKDYELGNMYSRYYSIEDLKNITDEQLKDDLERMKKSLSDIKLKIDKDFHQSFEDANQYIIESKSSHGSSDEKAKDLNTSFQERSTLGEEEDPPKNLKFPKKQRMAKKIDYVAQSERNAKTGLNAENIVMENERKFLMSNARLKKYIKCLKHVSQEEGDGAGYDIISYRLNKNNRVEKHYIEVKATNISKGTPFYMTENERSIAENLAGKYSIYRLYPSQKDDKAYGYYVLDDPINTNAIQLEPTMYRVLPKLKK